MQEIGTATLFLVLNILFCRWTDIEFYEKMVP